MRCRASTTEPRRRSVAAPVAPCPPGSPASLRVRTRRVSWQSPAMTQDGEPGAGTLDWAARVQRLEAEVAGLRRAMATRGVIEQAKGLLAARLGCDPEEAFEHLSRMSQTSNVRLAELAAQLVSSVTTEPAASAQGA